MGRSCGGRDRGKERKGGKGVTEMTSIVQNNSMVKSFPQQVTSEMKADDSARLFK